MSKFEKIRSIFCTLFRCSRIHQNCFGQITCARCQNIVGDSLCGTYNGDGYVVLGCDCNTCRDLYKKMNFLDKFLLTKHAKKQVKKLLNI